jgi:hypothetical protein
MAPDYGVPQDYPAERTEETPRLVEKRCPLHNVPLKEKTVSIDYGLIAEDLVESLVEPIFFPYAHTTVYSGCCMPGPEEETQVFYCDVCCEARRQWGRVEASIGNMLKR